MKNYTTNEKQAFIHGYAYAKAEFLKETVEKYKDTPIDTIIKEIINNTIIELNQKKEVTALETEQVTINVNGDSFQCECGSNLFTKMRDKTYQCCNCPLRYSSK